MLEIGSEIGIPGELVSDSKHYKNKYIRYVIDNYCNVSGEYELSNQISTIYLDKKLVEDKCKRY